MACARATAIPGAPARQREAMLEAMPAEERAAFEQREQSDRAEKYRAKVAQTARLEHAQKHGMRVVIDLGYGEQMIEKEERKKIEEEAAQSKAAAAVAAAKPWTDTPEAERDVAVLFPGQGTQKVGMAGADAWVRTLSDGRVAIALPNLGTEDTPMTVLLDAAGITSGAGAALRDVWNKADLGVHAANYTTTVATHDTLLLIATPQKAKAALVEAA